VYTCRVRLRSSTLALLVLGSITLHADSAAGLRWTAPQIWKTEAARPMRAATYTIPLTAGDRGVAECVVNYFGPGLGGSVEANIERWTGQMLGPDGKPALAKVEKRSIRGVPVVVVDSAGSYTGMGGPMASGKPVAGYRLLGAIAEGAGGAVFFKLTGPAKTVAAHESHFRQMLESLQRDK
jgi:hypothetical protein